MSWQLLVCSVSIATNEMCMGSVGIRSTTLSN